MLYLDDDVLLNRTAKAAEDIAWMAHLNMTLDAGMIQRRILDRLQREANSPTATECGAAPASATTARAG